MKATKMRVARVAVCLGQKELAKIVGVSHVTIGKAEKGDIDNIKFGTLKKISEILGVSFGKLFLIDDEN